MKNLFRRFPAFAPDYVGVSAMTFNENAITIFVDPHGCNGQSLYYMDPRYDDFKRMPKSFSCGLRERDTILGIDNLIIKKVKDVLKYVSGNYVVLVGTPVSAILGIDFKALAKRVEESIGIPVLGIPTTGLTFYDEGQGIFLNEILEKVETNQYLIPDDDAEVNIIGCTPLDDWDYSAILDYIKLINECGIKSISIWGQDNLLQNIKNVSKSRLNIAVSSAAVSFVKKLEEKYSTPYIIGFPIGTLMYNYYKELIKSHLYNKALPLKTKQLCKHTIKKCGLIIGNPINSCMWRDFFINQKGFEKIDIGSCFNVPEPLLKECNFIFKDENELEKYLQLNCEYDFIMGDPLFNSCVYSYNSKFINFPSVSVSGCLYKNQMERNFGKWGNLFYKHHLSGI